MVRGARHLTAACFLLFLAGTSPAQDVRLTASIDSPNVRIGEWIRLRIRAESSPSLQSIVPIVADSLGPFEVLRIHTGIPRTGGEERTQTWNLRLTSFNALDGVIPPVAFKYTLAGDSTPRFASTLPVPVAVRGDEIDPKGDIKEIKPPMNPPWALEDFIPFVILTLIALAAAAAYYIYRRLKSKKSLPEPERVHISPHEQALYALRALEDKHLWQQGKIKAFYSEVTDILRRFFEGRFGILALEMTSDEIMQQLKRIPEAEALLKEIDTFFLTADLVKFAKYQATPAEHERELKWAYDIVRSMIPRPKEPQPEEEVSQNAR